MRLQDFCVERWADLIVFDGDHFVVTRRQISHLEVAALVRCGGLIEIMSCAPTFLGYRPYVRPGKRLAIFVEHLALDGRGIRTDYNLQRSAAGGNEAGVGDVARAEGDGLNVPALEVAGVNHRQNAASR